MLAADLLTAFDGFGPPTADQPPSGFDALFAPGTSADYMAQIRQALDATGAGPSDLAQYQTTQRWGRTSTDGGGLNWGDATTITWSIAPDGTQIPGYAGESSAASNFVSFMDGIYGSAPGGVENQPWFSLVASVFDRWSQVSGLHFVYEPHDDGAAFSDYASSAPGAKGVRGDVRIGGHAIDGNAGTLAYNFFPDNGEMVLDTSDNFFFDTSASSLRLRNVMAHESGHGIGLAHVDPVDQTKLMEPYASTAFDGPQQDDILAAQRLYGDKYEAGAGNDSFGTATNLGDLNGRSATVGNNAAQQFVSIDGSSDVDYFHFTAKAGAALDAALSPIGHTYLQGPEGGTATSFNSLAQNDLVLEVYDANHTLIARADRRGPGGGETLSGLALQAGGDYYLRVRGKQDAAQLYRLNASVSGGSLVNVTTAGGAVPAGAVDFNKYSIDPYGDGQDFSGTAAVASGGAALHLTGNRWKKIDFPYTITSNTVLEFDFSSSAEGEIQGIGFDSNTSISSALTFRLSGRQDWGIANYANYTTSSGARHYVIPVGQFYTGKASMLFFTNDDDVSNPAADSVFSNVRVYERDGSTPAVSAPAAAADRYAVYEDSAAVSLNVLANDNSGGGTLAITKVGAGSAGGTIGVAANQTLTYRPAANFNGTETFSYTIGNTAGQSTGTVTVTVRAVNDPPTARNDAFTVAAGSQGNVLNVLGNDTAAPDAGETLTVVKVGAGSAGGKLSSDGKRVLYTPAAGYSGTETFSYTVGDGTAGSYATATVTVSVQRPASGSINFNNVRVDSYGGQQDFSGTAVAADGGSTLKLTGNVWKKIDLPYTITPNTVLEFDFSSGSQGEIHGIGFDSNTSISSALTFRLYGTQNWGIGSFDNYSSSSGARHYVIPVGRYYTGQASNLFFVNDDDVSRPTAQSAFSNVRINEAGAADKAAVAATAGATAGATAPSGLAAAASAPPALDRVWLDALQPPAGDSAQPSSAAPPFLASFTSEIARALADVAAAPSNAEAPAASPVSAANRPDVGIGDLLEALDARGLAGDWTAAVDRYFASLGE